ncbi:hypothetical protein Scep_000536 [Stephania cephalantha]|uniref:Exocyst subunit Exo70 family protein n=1 Tax=Stephania cephalantha TaxID=152367 RepID=A0AAP0L919_9MAGN
MNPRNDEDPALAKLQLARSNLKTLLQNSVNLQTNLSDMDRKLTQFDHSLLTTSQSVAPLHSLAISTKALDARVNRALSPALALLSSFKLAYSIQQKLIKTSPKLQSNKDPDHQKLDHLIVKYVDWVDRLNGAIDSIGRECEPAIQKLQEVVEFLGRTKAADHCQTLRLREALVTLRALYREEIDAMRYEGVLDEALVSLQHEFERVLMRLKHRNVGEVAGDQVLGLESLGSGLEIELLKRIAETLGRNDCLDICIDIYVKGRYKRAAKALMRLNPQYLRTYAPEDIYEMEWEHLETAIALWIQHFELALKTVLVSEKNLCNQVLGGLMDGAIWPECFTKIADKIMAVFFRFGEGVARSSKEPQKLFKLLDMFDSLEKVKPELYKIFEGEAGADICSRFRELEKLLVHSSSKVLWEFGLQIESNHDGLPPPQDGSVPKLVRYAINYLKYLISNYSTSMARILRTEQVWKAGVLAEPEPDDYLLKDAITNVMEAIERNTNAKKSQYKDKANG